MVSAVELLVEPTLFDVMRATPRNKLWLQPAASVQTWRMRGRKTLDADIPNETKSMGEMWAVKEVPESCVESENQQG
jgi:hypothetical protein